MRGILVLLAACAYGSAQSADPPLTFEVASVKMVGAAESAAKMTKKSAARSVRVSADPIRFSRRNATLASLLLTAYGLQPQQLIGPEWLTSERYEIEAKVPDGATAQQQLVMLRNLLAERFRVKVHREKKEIPVYEMVTAKGGPKLEESVPGAEALPAIQPGNPFRLGRKDGITMVILHEQGTMEALAARLSGQAGRVILDRTGLKGNFDVTMHWTPPTVSSSVEAAADPGMNLFAALESQLGLKLEPKKGMVDVLVVDHAEKVPTDN